MRPTSSVHTHFAESEKNARARDDGDLNRLAMSLYSSHVGSRAGDSSHHDVPDSASEAESDYPFDHDASSDGLGFRV